MCLQTKSRPLGDGERVGREDGKADWFGRVDLEQRDVTHDRELSARQGSDGGTLGDRSE